MRRLVLTNDASGVGNLKVARIGDVTIGVSMVGAQIGLARYGITGPLPSEAETADFFGAQRSREPLFWQSVRGPIAVEAKIAGDWLMGFSEFCRSFDVVECWFDPDVDGQLNLVHLLDFVRSDPATAEKLLLVHPEAPLGGTAPATIAASSPVRTRLDRDHLLVAHRFWTAYRQPNPKAFARLLDADLSALPSLDSTVPRLLAELPSVETGLSATEMQILERVGRPDMTWHAVFQALRREVGRPVFSFGYAVDALERLGRGPSPAVLGVLPDPARQPEPCDPEVLGTHRQSRLSLTPLGRALVALQDDFCRHSRVHRWWGNTELTNGNLWRWDPIRQELTQPV